MVLNLLVLSLSIPIGLLIAWLTRDELIDGFVYISTFAFISFFSAMIFYRNEFITLSLGFMSIVAYISVLKRYDKHWAVERNR